MSSTRVFFALWPDDRQRDRLRDVINSVAKTVEGRAVDRRNWHVTLAYVGDFPAERVPELLERARQITFEPFRLSFDRLEFWARVQRCLDGGDRAGRLEALVAELHRLLQDFGVVIRRPDLSAAYHGCAERPDVRRPSAWRKGAVTEWSSFELLESSSSPGGVTYQAVKQ